MVRPDLQAKRIMVVGEPRDGGVDIVTVDKDGHIISGRRRIGVRQLHQDMLTKDGKPRRNGYVLEVEL